jgi:hypothetical protein
MKMMKIVRVKASDGRVAAPLGADDVEVEL